ncbi:MAG: bifunctional riboflavin kinase/FAD synthetase [Armatimonadota bacterium]|nr:bifunctional riboflavin kinase/FAD synthetase [bacterium]
MIYGLENVDAADTECAVAIGVFDGVHWGHRAIFEQLLRIARERGLTSAALTFDRHPTEILSPTRAPQYISTLDQRIEMIESIGVDKVIVAEFNHELAGLSRDEFVNTILVNNLRARQVVVGSNFRFGKGREGDTRYLIEVASKVGIGVSIVPSVIVDGGPASSTRIRALISRGDVAEAAKLLGRRFALRGTVVRGQQIGRTLGFPTANLHVSPRQVIPARGVYVVESVIGATTYSGLCNIGNRPTFVGLQDTIEVHYSDFEGDVYGATLDVVFCRRLRDEMAFESPEKLVEQIKRDLENKG